MNRWIKAARPLTLPAAISPVVVGACLVENSFSNPTFFLILSCAVLIQINTNFVNDLFDFLKGADTANRIGPIRTLASGLINPAEMKIAILVVSVLSLLLGFYLVYLGGLPILLIGVFSLLFSFLYTAGPYPLAYLGLGEIFVLLFFGPIASWGTTWILSNLHNSEAIFYGLAPGMFSSSLLIVNNIRDYKTDQQADKKTLIVRFGQKFGKVEFSLFLILPIIITALKLPAMLLLLPLAVIPIYKVYSFKEEKHLLPVLLQVVMLLTAYTVLFVYLKRI